jgi:hypothetical protein
MSQLRVEGHVFRCSIEMIGAIGACNNSISGCLEWIVANHAIENGHL